MFKCASAKLKNVGSPTHISTHILTVVQHVALRRSNRGYITLWLWQTHNKQSKTTGCKCDRTDDDHKDSYDMILPRIKGGYELDGNRPPGVVMGHGDIVTDIHA